jgi:uncharacterized membrane protein YjjP (DUF1212 family)
MELVSTLASRLAASGAETYRVEESVRRICSAYGLDSRVYAIPHTLLITIMIPGERPLTQLCRMDHLGTDLEAVEQYSNLSRRICTEKPDWEEALRWLDISQQTQARYGLPMDLLGHVLVSSGFCLFFGGSGMDALCAGLCGLLLGFLTRFLGKTNAFFQKIISAFLMALLAYGCSALGLTDNVDTSVIGALMLLVPGILFTNALRDITFGDTNSGINRIVEVVLIAVAISLGTAAAWNLSVSLWGAAVNTPVLQYGPVLQCIFAIIASYGFVVIFNIHGFGSFLCALGGGITWAAFCIVQALGGQDLMCYFLATVVAAVFAEDDPVFGDIGIGIQLDFHTAAVTVDNPGFAAAGQAQQRNNKQHSGKQSFHSRAPN